MSSFPSWIESSGQPSCNPTTPFAPRRIRVGPRLTFRARPESDPVEGMIGRFVRHSNRIGEIGK